MPLASPDCADPASAAFAIVVVNYNYADYVGQAIDSALGQTLAGCEVVVVDDASTDGSRGVIGRYGDRVTAVFRDANGGMSAAVNAGYAHTTAPLVLFLDADDFLYPDAAARIAGAWRPGVAQVQARLHLVDGAGRVEDIFPAPEVRFDTGDVVPSLAARGRYSTTVTTGLAFARAALEGVMPIPERAFDRSADGYLATVAPLYGEVVAIEEPIGAYRRHDSNHSGFGANMATRARWRVAHDDHRYAALRDHGGRVGVAIAPAPGMACATHLEQRLTSLLFQPAGHAYPGDRRAALARAGARAAFAAPMSARRRATLAGMFLAAGYAPAPVARRALAWKLERSSRPRAIDWIAGRLRRLMG